MVSAVNPKPRQARFEDPGRPYGADVRLSSVGEDIILPIPFSGKSEKIYAYHLYGIVL